MLRRCLEKEPAERFQSARDFAFALELVPAPRTDVAPEGMRRAPSRAAALAVMLLAAAALAGAAVLFVRGPSERPRDGVPPARFGIPVSTTWSDAVSISPDGLYLFYGLPSANRFEQWALDLTDPAAEPVLIVGGVTLADETRVSPDGRWVAYHSNETGRAQVYVTRWPSTGEKWQVSPAGGVQPRWSTDGSELYYLDPEGRLMTVRMPGGDPRQAAAPEPLFATELSVSDALDQHEPLRTGFLLRLPVTPPADPAGVQVLVNWTPAASAGTRPRQGRGEVSRRPTRATSACWAPHSARTATFATC